MSIRRAVPSFFKNPKYLGRLSLVVVFIVSACAVSEHDQREMDRFQRAWTEKREGYAAQWLLANAEVRRQSDAAERLVTRRGASSWPAVAQATAHLTGAINNAFERAGRLELLSRFIERMDSGPSASSMRRWLHAEAERIGDDQEAVEARSAQLLAGLRDDPVSPRLLLRESEELAAEQGRVRGQANEFGALYQSAMAYFVSLEDGDAEALYEEDDDLRIAAQALARDISLRQAIMRQRVGEELVQPRACRQSGDQILCFQSHEWTQTEHLGFPDNSSRPWLG
ncbi:MAG: hypothetical protein H6905_03815 [Hyphomicrobiales bacterium]|nr:hypothetical protein [Hyphomicrobiales bacterium]